MVTRKAKHEHRTAGLLCLYAYWCTTRYFNFSLDGKRKHERERKCGTINCHNTNHERSVDLNYLLSCPYSQFFYANLEPSTRLPFLTGEEFVNTGPFFPLIYLKLFTKNSRNSIRINDLLFCTANDEPLMLTPGIALKPA